MHELVQANIFSSTIDLYTLSTAVLTCQQFYVSDKIINNSDNKVLILQKNKCNFAFLIFCFYTFLFNLRKRVK